MVDCRDDVAACEDAWYAFGTTGLCNATTGECVCPPGFDGLDSWRSFAACSVDRELRDSFDRGILILNCVDLGICILCLLYVGCDWGFLPKPDLPQTTRRTGNNSQSSTAKNPIKKKSLAGGLTPKHSLWKPPKETTNKTYSTAQRKVWRRKRDTILAFLFLLGFNVTGLFYSLPFFLSREEFPNGSIREDIASGEAWTVIQSWSLATSVTGLFAGLNALIVTWYNTLPSARRFGAILKMNIVFVNFPTLVYRLAKISTYVVLGLVYLFLWLLPWFIPDLQAIFDRATLAVIIIYLTGYVCTLVPVIKTLIRIFNESTGLLGDSGEIHKDGVTVRRTDLLRAIHTAKILLAGTCLGYAVAMVNLVLMLVYEKSVWVFFNIAIVVAHATSIFLLVLVAFRTSGGGAPSNRRRSSKERSKTGGGLLNTGGAVETGGSPPPRTDNEKEEKERVSEMEVSL